MKRKTKKDHRNKIHPLAIDLTIDLTKAFMHALESGLDNTAWCIDLALMAIGWELVAKAEGKPDLFVQNKIREKIEKDKGIKIRRIS